MSNEANLGFYSWEINNFFILGKLIYSWEIIFFLLGYSQEVQLFPRIKLFGKKF